MIKRISLWTRIGIILALFFPFAGGAETSVRSNIELYNNIYRGEGYNWYYAAMGRADIRFDSIGNPNVKGGSAVDLYTVERPGTSGTNQLLSLKRIWVKADFPLWRLTLGKTRLSWGTGTVFNSGDVLFGSTGSTVDFTQSKIRDETGWLVALNIPTGPVSFFEAVVLPPEPYLPTYGKNALKIHTIDRTSAGFRFFANTGGLSLEAGYVYRGDSNVPGGLAGHKPYIAVQGNAFFDIYFAASLSAGYDSSGSTPVNRDSWDEISSTVNFSLGLFRDFTIGYDNSLSFRVETMLFPWNRWTPQDFSNLSTGGNSPYAIMLYPEIRFMVRSAWFSTIQALISPIDLSASITAGFGWNVFQGFTLLSYFTVNAGEKDDLFATTRSKESSFNGFNITLGARYKY